MLQKQRIYSLILWAKDQDRVNEPIKFAQGTNQQNFRKMLTEALQRDQRRQDQKKSGASYLDSTFNTKLKSTVQWEKWLEELHTTLGQIRGVRGVPLTYVIREEGTPSFDPHLNLRRSCIAGGDSGWTRFRIGRKNCTYAHLKKYSRGFGRVYLY